MRVAGKWFAAALTGTSVERGSYLQQLGYFMSQDLGIELAELLEYVLELLLEQQCR